MAYGDRDLQFFKLRILAIHDVKYALTGRTFFILYKKLGLVILNDIIYKWYNIYMHMEGTAND